VNYVKKNLFSILDAQETEKKNTIK